MKEDFLHYLWRYQLFGTYNLFTVRNESITVLKAGISNKNSGPDFLNSKIIINNQIWFGNVEIHLKSSDWYLHQHEININYDAVILHVVWEHDEDVFIKNNTAVATIALKQFINVDVLQSYQKLYLKKPQWIPCETEIHKVDVFVLNNWLERLFINRLETKSIQITQLLQESNNDWEMVLFQLLSKNFGLKVNGESFLKLAKSIPFSIIRKEQRNHTRLSALLFGQAGFLSDTIQHTYHQELKKEYKYLQYKYQLTPISKNEFQFFRMRPSNFPTIRIAQLTTLYHNYHHLFSMFMEIKTIEKFRQLFKIELPKFWDTHINFKNETKYRKKQFTSSFLNLLFINTILPLQFCYLQKINNFNEFYLFEKIKGIKSEKNSIISKFSELNIKSRNALESQALIELKNNYCNFKRCLDCAIGNNLISTTPP